MAITVGVARAGRILVVDDDRNSREMLARLVRAPGREVAAADDGDEALQRIDDFRPDVVLSDIYMPRLGGVELLQVIKSRAPETEVVLLTGARDTSLAIAAIRAGAADYLVKPIDPDELGVVLERTLEKSRLVAENRAYRETLEKQVEERTQQLVARTRQVERLLGRLEESYETTLNALAAALDLRDNETHDHSARVAAYAARLGQAMGLEVHALRELRFGALLHDVGKIAVPDAILRSSQSLSDEDWERMKTHPFAGWEILRRVPFLTSALDVVLCHHERWDGGGYPRGLSGDGIPLAARIFSVVDSLDAITSERPYRTGRSFAEAREMIAAGAGTQFSPEAVEAFLRVPESDWKSIRTRYQNPSGERLALDVTQWRA
jgi:response regulator RpfG family c-di-GMP phosphodiesterase